MRKKYCTRCCKNKNTDKFRVREKNGYTYLNPTCRVCDRETRREHYQKVKKDPKWVAKNRDRVNKYRVDNYNVVLQKERLRKKTQEHKEYMKNYRAKNRAKIRSQHKIVSTRWAKKQRQQITEQYVLQQLCHPIEGLSREDVKKYPELIKYLQLHIKFKRLCKSKTSVS